jgi:hypothetical protein
MTDTWFEFLSNVTINHLTAACLLETTIDTENATIEPNDPAG